MLFATHLVIAAGLGRGRLPTLWVVAGAALPDLIDKPLAMAGLVPTYHSAVHSVLFGSGFAVALFFARRTEWLPSTERIGAVVLGWGSHLGADALHITLNGRPGNTVFLLWPVVSSWDSIGVGPGQFFLQYIGTTSFYLELVVWLCVGVLLVRDGRPDAGLPSLRSGE